MVSVARPAVGRRPRPALPALALAVPGRSDPRGLRRRLRLAGGDDGNGGADLRLSAITPEGQFLYDREIARPVDYLMATTLRPEGSYHFVSGGAFGTFPAAT